MIDQEQIDKSTRSIELAIANCLPTPSDKLFKINSVVDTAMIDKLKIYLTKDDSNKWEYFQNNNLRKVIKWDADTVVEELHMAFDGVTDLVSQQFSNQPLNFLGLQLWKDANDYCMAYHIDNPIIAVAIQLYLYDAPRDCGTVFKIDKEEYLVPFEHNTGYICKNQVLKGVPHMVKVIIPPNTDRYSLYAAWSRSKKEESTC